MKVIGVEKNSPAYKAGVRISQELIAINGHKVIDVLDILHAEGQSLLTLTVVNPKGKTKEIRIQKEPYEELGFQVDDRNCLNAIECDNNCLFCFVKQLPAGMRDSLYVKDDDYRLSMMDGCYITLTNLTEEDIDRIIRLKISPLYVSIHAYDDRIRSILMGNKNAVKTIDILKRLIANGIQVHTQVVVCQGLNDGEILNNTIEQLHSLYPSVSSVAVIPVGLTKYRENLPKLEQIDYDNANSIIDMVESLYEKYKESGSGFVWCSDEMYLKAQRDVKPYDYYEDFSQIDNGVGLISTFEYDLNKALNELDVAGYKQIVNVVEQYYDYFENEQEEWGDVSLLCVAEEDIGMNEKKTISAPFGLITGVSFEMPLSKYAKLIHHVTGIKCTVYAIKNEFFGESITVAGLITGGDIINQLKGVLKEDQIIIPSSMLKAGTNIFLDDITIKDVEAALGVKVLISHNATELVDLIVGQYHKEH